MAPGTTGSRTTSARCRGESGGPGDRQGPCGVRTYVTGLMSCPRRRPPGTTTAGHPAAAVVGVHVGRRAQRAAPAAHAQHGGGPGGSRAHAEGRRHSLRAPHPLGGEQPAGVGQNRGGAGSRAERSGPAHALPIPSQAPPLGAGGGTLLPGAVEQQQPQFVSRFLEGQSGVTIKHVACGDLFTACLTGERVRALPCGDSALRRPPEQFPSVACHLLITLLSSRRCFTYRSPLIFLADLARQLDSHMPDLETKAQTLSLVQSHTLGEERTLSLSPLTQFFQP